MSKKKEDQYETDKEWEARTKNFKPKSSDMEAIKKQAIADIKPEIEKMLKEAKKK